MTLRELIGQIEASGIDLDTPLLTIVSADYLCETEAVILTVPDGEVFAIEPVDEPVYAMLDNEWIAAAEEE